MARMGVDESLVDEFVGLFLKETEGQMQRIREAHAAGDAATLERLGHTLKGAAGSMCANGMLEAASRLELSGRSGDLAAAGKALAEMEGELARLRQEADRHAGP